MHSIFTKFSILWYQRLGSTCQPKLFIIIVFSDSLIHSSIFSLLQLQRSSQCVWPPCLLLAKPINRQTRARYRIQQAAARSFVGTKGERCLCSDARCSIQRSALSRRERRPALPLGCERAFCLGHLPNFSSDWMFYFPCSVKEAIPFLEREDVLGSEARFAALGGDAIALVSNQITKAAA